MGEVKGQIPSVGIWLSVEKLEEKRPGGKRVVYVIKPPVCLIRWDFIIQAQLLGEKVDDIKSIGFQPVR